MFTGSAKKSPSRPSSKEGKRDKSKSPARSRSGSKADTGKKSGKGSRGKLRDNLKWIVFVLMSE